MKVINVTIGPNIAYVITSTMNKTEMTSVQPAITRVYSRIKATSISRNIYEKTISRLSIKSTRNTFTFSMDFITSGNGGYCAQINIDNDKKTPANKLERIIDGMYPSVSDCLILGNAKCTSYNKNT